MSIIETFVGHASPALGPDHADLLGAVKSLGCGAEQLLPLLHRRNGCYAFLSALHVRGVETTDEPGLVEWNSPQGWRSEYGPLVDGMVFFAEDVFGGQFAVTTDGFRRFDIELGESRAMGATLDEWLEFLLSDWDYYTGCTLAKQWQERNGPLPVGRRLFPKTMFALGGDYSVDNLWCGDTFDNLALYGYIANHLHGHADGSEIIIELPNGKTIAGRLQR